jgi:glutathione synthase/RimK-type ligase-like ATP-grasp enzyme
MHYNIWGSNSSRSNSLERDLQKAFLAKGISADIVNMEQGVERSGPLLIRNKFYGYLKKREWSTVREHIKILEQHNGSVNDSESLLLVRDKLLSTKMFRELGVPHVQTYRVGPENLMDFVNYWGERVPGGVILKDRYGGKGKGIIRVQRQDSNKYLVDVCGVDGIDSIRCECFKEEDFTYLMTKVQDVHELIGQPYVVSTHERSTDYTESESIRLLCADDYTLGMSRRAEGPINNIAVSKNSLVQGRAVKTEGTPSEITTSNILQDGLGLRVMGNDFIRTDLCLYEDIPGVLWVPDSYDADACSILLEVNGNVQYGGIQELYQTNVSGKIVEGLCGGRDSNPRTH